MVSKALLAALLLAPNVLALVLRNDAATQLVPLDIQAEDLVSHPSGCR
jgi:hypothetical protein